MNEERYSRFNELVKLSFELGEALGNYGEPFSESVPSRLNDVHKALIKTCVNRVLPIILKTREVLEQQEFFGDNEFEWNDADNHSKIVHFKKPNIFGITYTCQNFRHLLVVEQNEGKVDKVSAYRYFLGKDELTEQLASEIKYSKRGLPKTVKELADVVMRHGLGLDHDYGDNNYHGFTLDRLVKAIENDETFYHSRVFKIDYTMDRLYSDPALAKILGEERAKQGRELFAYQGTEVYDYFGLHSLFLDINCTLDCLKEEFNIPDEDEIEE